MIAFDYSILRCPVTKEKLEYLQGQDVVQLMVPFKSEMRIHEHITEGFINSSHTYFFPVFNDIILLLPLYALYIGSQSDQRTKMAFDKERVFNYYNQISYNTADNLRIYEDSARWVDFREVTSAYIRNSFTRASRYLTQGGKYLLDIASGPIGLKEYVELSDSFEIRICADISINALVEAKYNYRNRPGIFICADITNIPLADDIVDSVLCQHTLYHIPREEQKTAVEEMHRVTRTGGAVVIVYSLFYHSWFMNLTLMPIQLYRIARHFAGKFYVRLVPQKPRLYFYPHSISWFRKTFRFGNRIEFYCWRSTNKYFLNLYVHKWLYGKKLLRWLRRNEDRYSAFWGRFGEYPMIVIKK